MKSLMSKLLILTVTATLLAHCTKKEEKPKSVIELENSYKKAQENLSTFDAKIKAAGTDEGLTIQLNYDKELAKSRVERLREQLKVVSPETLKDEAAAAAGGGHGGGH